jgi:hypothetical protein
MEHSELARVQAHVGSLVKLQIKAPEKGTKLNFKAEYYEILKEIVKQLDDGKMAALLDTNIYHQAKINVDDFIP